MIDYQKHIFTYPFETISTDEFLSIKNDDQFLKRMTQLEWQIFHESYKVKFVILSVWMIANCVGIFYVDSLDSFWKAAVGFSLIVGGNIWLSSLLSISSLWKVIKAKRRYYGPIKMAADASGSYEGFLVNLDKFKQLEQSKKADFRALDF